MRATIRGRCVMGNSSDVRAALGRKGFWAWPIGRERDCNLQTLGVAKATHVDILKQPTADPASTLAMALIIASQAPVLLLDGELDVVAASASFYRSFDLDPPEVGRVNFADMGAGEWNLPQLIQLLRATALGRLPIESYEMDLVRPDQPTCRLVLSANKLDYQDDSGEIRLVLAVTDVTAARLADKLKDDMLHEKHVLMQELQHRVANSLQIIASVLLQSARRVNSEETRSHLSDAHHRVLSVATLQKQLAATQEGEVALRPYFTELCQSISASMIARSDSLTITATVDDSKVDARVSVSLGLIATELVINGLKHAFPRGQLDGRILVDFRSSGEGWTLRVDDNGAGYPLDPASAIPGLGTGIVEALAQQLDATVIITAAHPGTTVRIVHEPVAIAQLPAESGTLGLPER
jgi:two-component system, sensor histidine kinase PdtaS